MTPDPGTRARGARRGEARIATVPNAISLGRLVCVPVFCWLLFGVHERGVAVGLLAALGATDWVDGWIARRFDQTSEVGKVLDPTADRVLLLTSAVALLVDGSVPVWFGVAVLARETVISLAVLALALAHAARIDVQWVGKAGTLSLMFAFPGFLLAAELANTGGHDLARFGAWGFALVGLALSYYAAIHYVPLARAALRQAHR